MNKLFTLVLIAFVALIILGTAFAMTHNVAVTPTIDAHAAINATCNAVAALCSGK